MPATQPSKDLRPLCHEHLLEMRLNRSFLNNGDDATQATTYGCTEPDCLVRYNTHRGYFMLSQNGNGDEEDLVGLASQETQDLGGENKAQSEPTGTRHI